MRPSQRLEEQHGLLSFALDLCCNMGCGPRLRLVPRGRPLAAAIICTWQAALEVIEVVVGIVHALAAHDYAVVGQEGDVGPRIAWAMR